MKRLQRCVFLALLPLMTLPAFARTQTPVELLQSWMYRYELCNYCGFSDPAIHDGYRTKSRHLVDRHAISHETYEAVKMRAWVDVYREWQNRGLGGFKNWCRTDGEAAAKALRATLDQSG